MSSYRKAKNIFFICCVILLISGSEKKADAADFQNLPAVKPVMTCEQLAQADFSKAADATITIKTAKIVDTPKGQYCRIVGQVEPRIAFHADLPIEHWTQRYLQNAQGRYGDFTDHAEGCMPALNGEIAVATTGAGGGGGGNGGGGNGGPGGNAANNAAPSPWGTPPQERINWAYMSNHMIVVAMKGIIKVFYGQPQKFAYMMGCSEGGRQSLEEAQRFPEDFDGISAGAPVVYDSVHNLGFWHGWEYHIDQRADGSIIMSKDKLAVLHAAVLEHCAAASGVIDGVLQQPTACTFDKSWVQCKPGATDTSSCLTGEEANVAEQLYLGPNDGKNFFEVSGWPMGSELQWHLSSPGKPASGEALNPNGIHRTLMPPLSGESTKDIMAKFTFTQDWWDKTLEMVPLMNAGNTNLRPFAQHGDKLILWDGAEDTVVQPAVPISYYEGVQKELGTKTTDSFMRYFLLPGVGHCGGGEGPTQVDLLGPLMAWVEMHKEPKMLVAGKTVPASRPGGPAAPGAAPPMGGAGQVAYATEGQPATYTRPIYPFPYVARYTGKGDPNDAANYEAVKGPLKTPQPFTNETAKLLGPNNQKFYRAENDKLLEAPKP
jgi:feruloyl esterase